jgi:hypothetical protein
VRLALRLLMAVLGVSAIAIALSIFLAGAQTTAAGGERVFDLLTGWRGPASPPWPATMDSELRFYAPFWGAYGVLLLLCARDFAARAGWTPWLAGVFFAGGLGRAISWAAAGPPHPFFSLLMAIELAAPPAMIALWLGQGRGGA